MRLQSKTVWLVNKSAQAGRALILLRLAADPGRPRRRRSAGPFKFPLGPAGPGYAAAVGSDGHDQLPVDVNRVNHYYWPDIPSAAGAQITELGFAADTRCDPPADFKSLKLL